MRVIDATARVTLGRCPTNRRFAPTVGANLRLVVGRSRIAKLAERQHGVLSRAQLQAMGFEPGAVVRRLGRGRLHTIHRGVYSVGHPGLTVAGRWMAAVLAGGPGAVLSHRSAAALWELWADSSSAVHVSISSRRTSRTGIRIHETAVRCDECCLRDGIPVTTVARTLLDLASVLDRERLEQAMSRAEARQLADSPSLPDLVERYPGRRGITSLRAILADSRLGLDLARSELEIRFLEFLRARGLPRPELNAWLEVREGQIEVDCLWRDAGLVAELDSRAHHSAERAFETDRLRDRMLIAAGWRCTRITWQHLHRDPEGLAADLRPALALSSRATSSPSNR